MNFSSPSDDGLQPPWPRAVEPDEGVQISVVVPLYRCESCIEELYRRLTARLESIPVTFEIVLVNDGSPEGDWDVVRRLAGRDRRVKAVNLSRNFGQHYAISAGLDHAGGQWVVVMDGDLQDPPEAIAALYARALEGHDIVYGRKPQRNGSLFKRATSRAFTWLLGFLMDEKLDNAVTHFSIVSRRVVQNLRRLDERNRSYAFLLRWLGFDAVHVDVEHHSRHAGTSSYTLGRMLRLASELVVSQSDKPLRLSIRFGFIIALLAFAYGSYVLLNYMLHGTPVTGWTSLIVSLYFLAGVGFVALGVVGLYIGRIFEESKRRPLYIVRESLNMADSAAAVPRREAVAAPAEISIVRQAEKNR